VLPHDEDRLRHVLDDPLSTDRSLDGRVLALVEVMHEQDRDVRFLRESEHQVHPAPVLPEPVVQVAEVLLHRVEDEQVRVLQADDVAKLASIVGDLDVPVGEDRPVQVRGGGLQPRAHDCVGASRLTATDCTPWDSTESSGPVQVKRRTEQTYGNGRQAPPKRATPGRR
jgi:hypothetical protein